MKKKLLTLLLTLVALAAFAGVGISAAAAGTKDAVTVKNANWSAWNMVAFETDTDSGYPNPWGPADPAHITVLDPEGNILEPNAAQFGMHIYIGVNGNTEPAVGTTFTIHAGYAYTANSEVKEDITWKYSTQGATFTKVEPTGAVESVAVAGRIDCSGGRNGPGSFRSARQSDLCGRRGRSGSSSQKT